MENAGDAKDFLEVRKSLREKFEGKKELSPLMEDVLDGPVLGILVSSPKRRDHPLPIPKSGWDWD